MSRDRQRGFIMRWLVKYLLWIFFLGILLSIFGGALRSIGGKNSLTVNAEAKGVVVGFFNGVWVVYDDAVEHQSRLYARFGDKAMSEHLIQYQLFYNYTHGRAEDLLETYDQRMSIIGLGDKYELFWDAAYGDGVALHRAVNRIPGAGDVARQVQKDFSTKFSDNLRAMAADKRLKTSLEHHRLIGSLTGKKSKVRLVLVAHSQGNLYALPAFAYAAKRSKKVAIVHAAPPIDIARGDYILSTGDAVINSLRPNHIFPANVDSPSCVDDCLLGFGLGHGFAEVYFNKNRAAGKKTELAISVALNGK